MPPSPKGIKSFVAQAKPLSGFFKQQMKKGPPGFSYMQSPHIKLGPDPKTPGHFFPGAGSRGQTRSMSMMPTEKMKAAKAVADKAEAARRQAAVRTERTLSARMGNPPRRLGDTREGVVDGTGKLRGQMWAPKSSIPALEKEWRAVSKRAKK